MGLFRGALRLQLLELLGMDDLDHTNFGHGEHFGHRHVKAGAVPQRALHLLREGENLGHLSRHRKG
jgi:hypothetical protein